MDAGTEQEPPEDTQARPIPPRYRWLKRILLVAVLLVVGLVCVRLWWGHVASTRLQAEIDRYRAAGQPIFPADFDPPPIPDEDNAALVLRRAEEAMTWPEDVDVELGDLVRDRELVGAHLDEVARIIEVNSEALVLLRKARSMTRADWGIRYQSPLFELRLPDLQGQRTLSKLLCVAATYYHHAGDDSAAVEALRDTLSLSARLEDMRGVLIGHLVAVAISAVATGTVEEIAPSVVIAGAPHSAATVRAAAPREQVDALIADLLDEQDMREGWLWALYGERAMQLDMARQLMRGDLEMLLSGTTGPGEAPLLARAFAGLFKPMFRLDAARVLQYTTGVAEAGNAANYFDALEEYPGPPPGGSGFRRFTRSLSTTLLPSFTRVMELHFRVLALRRMAALALGVRLYELDHGYRPTALADLTPNYIPFVPTDPFAQDGREIGYLPEASKPIVYSIGSDGVDDQGAFVLTKTGAVDQDAKDLVFFLNGDRPRPRSPRTGAPGSEDAEEHDRDQDESKRDADHDQDPDAEPENRQGDGE